MQKLAVSSDPGPTCGREAWGLLALFFRLVSGACFRRFFGPVSPVQSGDHDSIYGLRFLARPDSDDGSHGFRLARSLVPSKGGPCPQQHPSTIRWAFGLHQGTKAMWRRGRVRPNPILLSALPQARDPGRNPRSQVPGLLPGSAPSWSDPSA